MLITVKNKLNKRDTIPVLVSKNGNIVLKSKSGNQLDITHLIPEDELTHIRRVGRAVAIVKDDMHMYISYCCNYHVHSKYSILDGMSRLDGIAELSSGVTALTDHGNMFAFLDWQKAMLHEGKKAIFGFEAYVEDVVSGEKKGSHLILLAKNEEGLKNIYKLTSMAYNNFYKKPHVSIDALKKCHSGVICTSACVGGELAKASSDPEKAHKIISFYKSVFGNDYYIEIQRHNFDGESEINKNLISLAKKEGVKIVAANDSHYLKPEDADTHKILLAISYSKKVDEIDGFEGTGYHFLSDKDMVNLFWDIPEAIANTLEIAEKCNVEVETGVYHMPAFQCPPEYKSDDEYLIYLLDKGFKERYGGTWKETDPEHIERLKSEKAVILKMHFSSYFLIVWDYVNWAKNNGIAVGPGRGSGAGSICLYCLRITEVDPLDYGLKFERFLNPDRISMPDVDVDFEDARRAEVIDYVKRKYGEDHVCNILTFGNLQAKNAIRDITRVLDYPYMFGDTICKTISKKAKNLKDSLSGDNKSMDLLNLINSDPSVKHVIEKALNLEGNPRQTSTHACGIIISDAPVLNYLPTAMVKDSNSKDKNAKALCSQVAKDEVEKLGLLKMDFLGLKMMSVIKNSIELANKRRTSKINNYTEITLFDPYVYKSISTGLSYGVFQLESEGMRSFMKKLFSDVPEKIAKITRKYGVSGFGEFASRKNKDYEAEMEALGRDFFDRIIAGISLYRPGPMDYIDDYLNGLKKPDDITYDDPMLESILSKTYGVIVYQEQVMDIVKKLAGFTAGQSDTIRKAMGKKIQELLDEFKPYFIYGSGDAIDPNTKQPFGIKGCIANGVPEDVATRLWAKMERFGEYAFNKSHACVYAVITIVCAWLKYYYPCEYMTSLLNTYIEDDKMKAYLGIIKSVMHINIIPPGINHSDAYFTTDGESITFGLRAIKGISKSTEIIENNRKSAGNYKSVNDFVSRTYELGVNESVFTALVEAGCFDEYSYSRHALINSADALYEKAKAIKKAVSKTSSSQLSFFDFIGVDEKLIEYTIQNCEEYKAREKMQLEKKSTGLYISAHPLDAYNVGATEITSIADDDGNIVNGEYTFAGTISELRTFYTKKGNKMANFVLSDRAGEIKITVFPKEYSSFQTIISDEDAIVVVRGEVQTDDKYGTNLIADFISDIDNYNSEFQDVKSVTVFIPHFTGVEAQALLNILNAHPGDVPVIVRSDTKDYHSPVSVNADSSLFMALSQQFKAIYN